MRWLSLGALSALCVHGLLARHAVALTREEARAHVFAAQEDPEVAFQEWALAHGRTYLGTAEEGRRFEAWLDNLEYVASSFAGASPYDHWLALNEHADLTLAEYRGHYLGFDAAAAARRDSLGGSLWSVPGLGYADADVLDLPEEVDWRDHNAVSYVKNQKQCGSCWAFSTTGAIEGVNAIYSGTLEVLSEQELLDCDTVHDHGCHGGLMDTAFSFVIDNGGIDTERDYRYHAREGNCSVNRENREVVTIDSYVDIPAEQPHALLKAVAHQPVAVAIQANQRDFQLYSGGVFQADCGVQLDHGVLVAGYGADANGTDFWLVKNSWGPLWGEDGYIRLERDLEPGPGKCGILEKASYPVKLHDNPPRPPKPAPDPPAPPPPPPTPPPMPVSCDSMTQCPTGTTCCCLQEYSNFCLQWACCPIPGATCCKDHVHCCPQQLPVCDVDHGRCLPPSASSLTDALAATLGEPWLASLPALRASGGAGALASDDGDE